MIFLCSLQFHPSLKTGMALTVAVPELGRGVVGLPVGEAKLGRSNEGAEPGTVLLCICAAFVIAKGIWGRR